MQLPVLHNSAVADLVAKFDQVPGLTKEEEFDLAVRLREDGDVDAAHRLITANLRNVVRIAMDYAGYGMPLEDICLLYTSPSPRDRTRYRMPSSA